MCSVQLHSSRQPRWLSNQWRFDINGAFLQKSIADFDNDEASYPSLKKKENQSLHRHLLLACPGCALFALDAVLPFQSARSSAISGVQPNSCMSIFTLSRQRLVRLPLLRLPATSKSFTFRNTCSPSRHST